MLKKQERLSLCGDMRMVQSELDSVIRNCAIFDLISSRAGVRENQEPQAKVQKGRQLRIFSINT